MTDACQHERLIFASGDYYVSCPKCGQRWGQLLAGRPEYGMDKDGREIGCHPAQNPGFDAWAPVREKVGAGT